MQDLNSTMFFVKVVMAGSFTQAAKSLGIPKQTISDKVSQLERDLGVTLLTRTTRKLKLTDVGETFFRKAEAGVAQLQMAGEEASQAQHAPTGVLRLTGPIELLSFDHVLEAVAAYRTKYPNVKVEMDFTERQVDMVAEGFDIALRPGDLPDSSLRAKRIGTGTLIMIASTSYLKKAPPLKHPKDLVNHSCIVRRTNEGVWQLKSKQGKAIKIEVPRAICANSFVSIRTLVTLGQGVALIPNTLTDTGLINGDFVRVLPDWSTGETPMYLVYPPHRFASPKVREMVPFMEQHLQSILKTRR